MLSGISDYLFGSGSDEPTEVNTTMETTDADDDWVLVDVTNGQSSSPRHIHPAARGQGSAVSVPANHRIEESWMVTPPPCFTAGGNSPHQLATSPMEDLLIEHPSMSVYHSQELHKLSSSSNTTPPSQMVTRARARQLQQEKQGKQAATTTSSGKKTRNLRVRNSAPPRRAAAVAARLGMVQEATDSAVDEVQTAKRLANKMMSRSKMSRQNKSYHQKSRGGHHHYRNDIMGRHSGAIYKQKC